jgi:hypothetical protein
MCEQHRSGQLNLTCLTTKGIQSQSMHYKLQDAQKIFPYLSVAGNTVQYPEQVSHCFYCASDLGQW